MTGIFKHFRLQILAAFMAAGLLVAPSTSYAQQSGSVPKELEPREAIGTILMSGLVGGILGLSTLSFYDRPQDNIRNISIGAGVGMIAAAIYLTASVANTSSTPTAKLESRTGLVALSAQPIFTAEASTLIHNQPLAETIVNLKAADIDGASVRAVFKF